MCLLTAWSGLCPASQRPWPPLTTPAHIVPEWYFLALYAILRSIPNKHAGVAAVTLVIITLFLIESVVTRVGLGAVCCLTGIDANLVDPVGPAG